jgi:hypothetical protein
MPLRRGVREPLVYEVVIPLAMLAVFALGIYAYSLLL